MRRLLEKWDGLSEWVRWLLCVPVIITTLLVAFIIGDILAIILLRGLSENVVHTLLPAVMTFLGVPILYFAIHAFVPRYQVLITGVLVGLSTILGVMSAARWGFYITGYAAVYNPPSYSFAQDALQTVTAVITSWFWFFYFKRVKAISVL